MRISSKKHWTSWSPTESENFSCYLPPRASLRESKGISRIYPEQKKDVTNLCIAWSLAFVVWLTVRLPFSWTLKALRWWEFVLKLQGKRASGFIIASTSFFGGTVMGILTHFREWLLLNGSTTFRVRIACDLIHKHFPPSTNSHDANLEFSVENLKKLCERLKVNFKSWNIRRLSYDFVGNKIML